MKLRYAILLLFLMFATALKAATVNLAWDANPANQFVVKYTLYEWVDNQAVKLLETAETTATISNVGPGDHSYYVTATNAFGIESGPSNEVTIGMMTPPANLRFISVTFP